MDSTGVQCPDVSSLLAAAVSAPKPNEALSKKSKSVTSNTGDDQEKKRTRKSCKTPDSQVSENKEAQQQDGQAEDAKAKDGKAEDEKAKYDKATGETTLPQHLAQPGAQEAKPEEAAQVKSPEQAAQVSAPLTFAATAGKTPAKKTVAVSADPVLMYFEQWKNDTNKIKIGKRLHSSVWHYLTRSNRFCFATRPSPKIIVKRSHTHTHFDAPNFEMVDDFSI